MNIDILLPLIRNVLIEMNLVNAFKFQQHVWEKKGDPQVFQRYLESSTKHAEMARGFLWTYINTLFQESLPEDPIIKEMLKRDDLIIDFDQTKDDRIPFDKFFIDSIVSVCLQEKDQIRAHIDPVTEIFYGNSKTHGWFLSRFTHSSKVFGVEFHSGNPSCKVLIIKPEYHLQK